ncbi:BCD family MFS transporter [Brevundimonas sp. TWP2-3-4b2]|uniref:BCD family MFS transporter n=1 Tax=Brevundimonas sp. TWP2-3-4b2 TaxID=2804595 RepID=UPI003CF28A2E
MLNELLLQMASEQEGMAAENKARWARLVTACLPFADAATTELPLGRLLRLSLFQVSVGMTTVLLTGTLNRVMIVELNVPAILVAAMVAVPLLFAPFRALIGFKSDTHRSHLGWRRGPYIWFGSLMQFGGLAIMPFALLISGGHGVGAVWIGHIAAMLAFLLVGAGVHTTQTAGLALANDLAPEHARPRVVALLYVMLLVGMLISGILMGLVLADFQEVKLVGVVQGAAVLAIVLNMVALWKQEAQDLTLTAFDKPRPAFKEAWAEFSAGGRASRLLVAVGLGAAAFSMQDILLEPYGGTILGLTVGQTTALTALWSAGTLAGLAYAARRLAKGGEPHRLAGHGMVWGILAVVAVICGGAFKLTPLFCFGVFLIGLGGGMFSVGTLTSAMSLARDGKSGIALGAWGAVQATAVGLAILVGGGLRDLVSSLAESGLLGTAMSAPATAYVVVYHLEIGLLFAALVAIGPLARYAPAGDKTPANSKFGLADLPA